MKKLKITLFLTLIALAVQPCWSQTGYPNVTADLATKQNLGLYLKHRITFPGVWGAGGETQYMFKQLVYAEAQAGYGWVIGNYSNAPDYFKKFLGWFSVKTGYPFLNFTSKKYGKWVVKQTSTDDYFYQVEVPAHVSLIALAGISYEPMVKKYNAVDYYSFLAPVYTFGVKFRSYASAKLHVKNETGSIKSKVELYVGIVIPIKNEIIPPNNLGTIPKSNKMGYELFFSFPFRLNSVGTFDVGIKSLGYDNKAQFYLGNTFYLK